MKKIVFLILSLLVTGQVFAETPLERDPVQNIVINKKKVGHLDQPILFDQPDVYLDTSNAVIIIDGGGEVSYYDVEIESMTTWLTVISTQVNGTYDTIDVSSLAPDEYYITITSPTGNEFEGYFEIE